MVLLRSFLSAIVMLIVLASCQEKKKKEIDLEELTISEILAAYEAEVYNSEELVKAYILRIEQFDEEINSISIINPEAISIARALDEEFAQTGKLRPLHGIPIIVKDNINTKGLPTTAGALALKDFIPEQDAFIIKKLVDAGAIILAKSNMAEWAFSAMHTESSTVGTTRNPYNLDHVPAGSSGGTAAAVASNFATIGLGTDTGNSIRGPSSHNALVGFRTTLGLVSRSAIVPLYLRNDVVGPMGRTVEDATRILDVIAGTDAEDPLTQYSEGKTPDNYLQFLDADGLKGTRIGVFRTLSDRNVDPEIKKVFDMALVDMQRLGADIIEDVQVPNFDELRKDQWCATFKDDLEDFLAKYVKNDTIKTLEDVIRIGTKSEFARTRLATFQENLGRWEDGDVPCGDAFTDPKRIAFREAFENTMDSLNLSFMVYPTWNHKAARIEFFQEEYKGDNSQIIAPHTGMPAFTVPMGYTTGNLPVGIQLLGRMFDEPTLIKASFAYEQATQHRKSPNQDLKK